MPEFTFTSPEGKKITVTGPEGSTVEQAFERVKSMSSPQDSAPPPQEKNRLETPGFQNTLSSFFQSAKERMGRGVESIKEATDPTKFGGVGAPFRTVGGLMDIGGGVLEAIRSPVTAAVRNFVSEPLSQASGKVLPVGVSTEGIEKMMTAPLEFMAPARGGLPALPRAPVLSAQEKLTQQAMQKITGRLTQDKMTAKEALDRINAGAAKGKPLTLADIGGENTKGLAGNIARSPGESRDIASSFLTERDKAAGDRLTKDIEKYVKGGPSIHATARALLDARSAESRPLWDQVRELQNVWSPRLQEFINDPEIKKGMARGYRLERIESLAEGRKFDPTQMGIDLDAEGNIKILRVPNMRALDMARQGLDAMIAEEKHELTGRPTAMGVGLSKLRQAYVDELKARDPSGLYAEALDAWGGKTRSFEAIKDGQAIFKTAPEEVADQFAKLSPTDQEFYRVGVAGALREKVLKTGMSGDEAKAILKSEWMQQQLRPVFRTPQEFNDFIESVTHEKTMFDTKFKTLGGSQTAARMAEDSSADMALGGAGLAVDVARGHYVTGGRRLLDLYRRYKDLGLRPNPQLNAEIARIMFETDTKELGKLLK